MMCLPFITCIIWKRTRMIRDLKTIGNTCSVVVLLLAAVLGFTGCSDVSKAPAPAPVPSPDAALSNLTINPGTLQPTFSSNVTTYTVDVTTSVTSVTVTAQPQVAGATISINGQMTTNLSVTLGAAGSSTPISIVVTAPNGSQSNYLVTVNRAALAGNNSLQSLTVSPGTLSPAFDANTLNYSDDVASSVSSVTVTATLQDTNASMTVNGQATNSGQARTITLGAAGSSTFVTILVTAPNGSQKTYLVSLNRAALGGDDNLSALSVSGQILNPAFGAGTLSYTVNVASTVTNVTVSATKSDPNAVMSGSITAGAGQATGQATIPLPGGPSSTPVSIIVTAPNGNQKTYTVTVIQAAPASDDNLSALSVTGQTLVPGFSSGNITYTVNVLSTVTSVVVSATKSDPNAVMSGNVTAGTGVATGQATIPLPGGPSSTPVSIIVTAPNGSQKTYTVTVNRPAPANSNNNLSALVVSAGPLTPGFLAGTHTYNVNNVANTTMSTTVTATVADSTATLTINGSAAISGVAAGPIALAVGANPIHIVVTAQDGTPNTYTVTVNRNAALSNNNNLSALVVSAATPALVFAPATLNYNVTAPTGTSSTTITATLADLTATLKINSSSAISGVASPSITLVPGLNPAIPILVTAQDGTPNTYTVTITVNK
jgi:hypothetical protein